ncbi:MAG: 23S rRNA (pseudouridine(1915)-N(3))-methyltransferase RlmH [Paracoccus sp. (in: a-proteobacteria)]|uniref:23S rRNA (pseudouridine(1915)-N(3))-methyltransferase RlmH n=1 Tax=Paracoccus sp. TaxID=267 RepID=UPI0026E0FD27|nr:23S rRNA (pseudouridine(1915)-N(3))-methyltransferase RlmH [Paracoccus sp. (in: a-proteobacteria)]MDO5632571.1 23S rRNA (pseudouridine(1915)-N(3))-methyltransferase RlmH [Paracoccus sp. (in: a-proteobacteria)]
MRITLLAVGRLRSGPEQALIHDYLDRFAKTGRPLGLPPVQITEVEDKKGGGMAAEALLLTRAIPEGAALAVMDERGAQMTSPEFATRLAGFRDQARDLCFVIGGADGLDPAIRNRADWQISLGRMVWPHMLVRVMLSEQLYRAASILGGSPYHRA